MRFGPEVALIGLCQHPDHRRQVNSYGPCRLAGEPSSRSRSDYVNTQIKPPPAGALLGPGLPAGRGAATRSGARNESEIIIMT